MPSEVRVDTIKTTSGLGTVSLYNHGQTLSGFTTVGTLSLNQFPIISMGQTINSAYNFVPGQNYLSVGPITISSGVVLTIPTGAVWTVV